MEANILKRRICSHKKKAEKRFGRSSKNVKNSYKIREIQVDSDRGSVDKRENISKITPKAISRATRSSLELKPAMLTKIRSMKTNRNRSCTQLQEFEASHKAKIINSHRGGYSSKLRPKRQNMHLTSQSSNNKLKIPLSHTPSQRIRKNINTARKQHGSLPRNISHKTKSKEVLQVLRLSQVHKKHNLKKRRMIGQSQLQQRPQRLTGSPKFKKKFKRHSNSVMEVTRPHKGINRMFNYKYITRQTVRENHRIFEILKPDEFIEEDKVRDFEVLDKKLAETKAQIVSIRETISKMTVGPQNYEANTQNFNFDTEITKSKDAEDDIISELEMGSETGFEINLKSQLRFGLARKIIDIKCNEIIDDKGTKERFLEKMEMLKTKRNLQKNILTNRNISSIQNADSIHHKIIRFKPKHMTDFEYRKMLINSRRNINLESNHKRAKFLVDKKEYLLGFCEKQRQERSHFLIMSKTVQTWTKFLLLNQIFRETKKYIEKRNADKRRAMAKFGSIAIIEKILGRFLKKYRDSRVRRCTNKIRFFSVFQASILKENAEHKCKAILLKFFQDRKSKCMMFYCFKSVERKVMIIQKRWKCKSEVNKERILFLKSYWNSELVQISELYEKKEPKNKVDKKILSIMYQINSITANKHGQKKKESLRDEILKDFYTACITTYYSIFRIWHKIHKKVNTDSKTVNILKNAFNVNFDTGEDNQKTGVQSLLKQKTQELRRVNTMELLESFIESQQHVAHFGQIGYELQYKIFRTAAVTNRRTQRLKMSLIETLGMIKQLEGEYEDLYPENDFKSDDPPVFIFLPSRTLIRKMIVDAILEINMELIKAAT
ncbi:unnamed protein product [Moneuplotes crassus]|uniref:Uncharacterized protein n=1 Tax=Euplotes crassus TaxID=5936 RepID=A0AAD1XL52_EUPCR|nr:unnamed protein product [Moneuplotes crassus]